MCGSCGDLVTLRAESFVCVVEALIYTKEAIMDQQAAGSGRWWEAATMILAINSVVFGFLLGSEFLWAVLVGWVPGTLLLVGLRIRGDHRGVATALITVSSIAAAGAFWMIYPVVLALVVIVGGFWTGMLGPRQAELAIA
jgi:hypothetical protein